MNAIVDIKAPENQEEGTRSRIARWLKQPGERVAVDEPLVELETDKVAMEVAAPVAGVLTEILLAEDSDVEPGALLGRIDSSPQKETGAGTSTPSEVPAAKPAAQAVDVETGTPAPSGAPDRRLRLSPLVKRLIKLHDVDPADIQGSGIGGRIRRDDVLAYV
ncbi:MAG: dihydrolipoamide succinyltransferase, partial [Alphaproteobacteria bacterium]